ncbi:MAG: hypothetical protein J0I19_02000 [Alphaproteobacteria bacterium]|nr:hypothetical protein [Alphaproteobacteria bacterium]
MRRFAKFISAVTIFTTAASQAEAICLAPSPTAPGGIISVAPRSFPVAKEFQDSSHVLTAKVISSKEKIEDGFVSGILYRVQPLQMFKGNPPAPLSIYSERNSGGFSMDVGRTYLLFVQRQGKKFAIDNCGYSDLLSNARQTIEELNAIKAR